MEKVLFVNCCIRREESRTKKLADFFLNELEQSGSYEIKELCLMDEGMPYMSEGNFHQRDALLAKKDFSHPRFYYAHAFANADKIVVAAPFWDLSFPALLKTYIENLCVEGITFGCNEQGCFGTCKADHMVYVTTRGGFYEGSHMEMGSRYMKAMCEFFGIEKYDCIVAEGLDIGLRPVDVILEEAMEKAKEVAKRF
ncbi:FMN-dependent NADH-azoreductase [Anaerotignum sp. MB30-C6]|uniref:FMN-dependent NADH-azoreductase n=1 Tax=Anaerotignum sp. MB30-C6 TaxID=3070814 RepID=UPI0027DCDD59|nr:NAD(P)H-dependent oxidoreductase [Anaerotignum sp. MB30-C6]WMI80102.1 NAD(P)H-dependent oxidoreductase [Anaerotignum sp. MB30-C6]